VRVRKLGYAPALLTLQLVDNDDREVVIRMEPLATGLDPVVVAERSGYGPEQSAWEDLERRKNWVNFKSRLLGPEDLKNFYGSTLDVALVRMGLNYAPSARDSRVTSIDPRGTSKRPDRAIPGSSCILLNGKTPVYEPIYMYTTDDVEMLEVWPGGTELTGTISSRFHGAPCEPLSLFQHPTYFVLWLKKK
jgi:hypothetical protein